MTQIRKRGEVKTPPDDGAAPCHPSEQMLVCATCLRFRAERPVHIDLRQFVVIDATVVRRPGQPCPMHKARPVVRPYAEPVEHEAEVA